MNIGRYLRGEDRHVGTARITRKAIQMTETPETLAQRLQTDILWHRRRCNETIARDIEEAAAALEAQAAQIAERDAQIDAFQDALIEIGNMAHDASTGPAVPDVLWEIRGMAYDAAMAAKEP